MTRNDIAYPLIGGVTVFEFFTIGQYWFLLVQMMKIYFFFQIDECEIVLITEITAVCEILDFSIVADLFQDPTFCPACSVFTRR